MLSDPVLQASIVGAFLSLMASAVTSYLWRLFRNERYLLYWSVAWAFGCLRWIAHYLATQNATMGVVEGLLLPIVLIFQVLGSFELLPRKPWDTGVMTKGTVALFTVAALVAIVLGVPVEAAYALFVGTLSFCAYCMWHGYRASRLKGYLLGVAASIWQTTVIAGGLLLLGAAVSNQLFIPLVYNTSLMLSIVVIAFQRRGRQLAESKRTLQKIFETAPTPIIIVRHPAGEIERANPSAVKLLGITADRTTGRSAIDQGIDRDPEIRRTVYAKLQSGQRIEGLEMSILRGGREWRTVSVNADRIELDGDGDHYIFSFYDLTDLRRAEEELRTSTDEMRRLYVRLANVEDEERRALHAELHDQIGANLAALRLELDIARSLFERNKSDDAQRRLNSVRVIATETAAMARDLMAELRPPALDDFGLTAALRDFAESRASRLNLPIHVTGEDLVPRAHHLVEGALFRIAYEAVTNAARHASASRVAISVGEQDGSVVLTVEDDGDGFDLEARGAGTDHWGLKNMRERARAVGGVLHIESQPGKGTRIKAEAPREAV